jgi:phytoene desaturase (3,4-didehydrolycopene-forming)
LADEYQDSFDDIFKRQQIPKEPSFYVNVPSRIDTTAAPPGKDAVVVLVPCGHLMEGETSQGLQPRNHQDWEAMVSKARSAVIDTVRQRTGVNLENLILKQTINTPASWKDRFNLDKGAILGLSHSFFNVLSFRPNTKHPSIKDLYFVGASTHPGTGVPIVLAGSKITTTQILTDLKMSIPWTRGHHQKRVVSGLDTEGRAPIELTRVVLCVAIFYLLTICFRFMREQT